jgi:DNA-binding NarL/FixJ family response regulator
MYIIPQEDSLKVRNGKIKVMLIDDHPVVRGGIAKFLEKEKDIEICGEADSASEAVKLINRENPHIVIIDITLKDETDGIELIKIIKSRFPDILTLCLSMYEESVYAERAIRAGAKGYVQKSSDPQNVIVAIRRILDGKLYLSEDISDTIISKLLHGRTSENTDNPADILSDREFQVFLLVAKGFGAKEIAVKMDLSVNTVETHKKNIKDKLKIENTAELNRFAIQWFIRYEKKSSMQ